VPIVADASPLILFARAGHLRLLADLFGEVVVPPRVAAEAYLDVPLRPGAAALAAAGAWLRIEAPTDQQAVAVLTAAVDAGEAEAIALAVQRRLPLLIDDLAGRRAAHERGVPVTGSGGVLVVAKRRLLIDLVRPVLDDLLLQGLRLSPRLHRQLLQEAGELPAGESP
jgi:predicted nucleic acid-binding protein